MVFFKNKYNLKCPVLSVNYYDKYSNPFNLNIVRRYSTKIAVLSTLKDDFFEWLCGLIDGEGSFYINKKKIQLLVLGLIYICDKLLLDCQTLGIGKVYVSGLIVLLLFQNLNNYKQLWIYYLTGL